MNSKELIINHTHVGGGNSNERLVGLKDETWV